MKTKSCQVDKSYINRFYKMTVYFNAIISIMTFEEKLLKDLIDIPSITGNEEKIAQYLYALLDKEGFEANKIFVDKKRFNVIAKAGKPKVYLQAHMDTVPPYVSYDKDDEFIYGRGSCDTKGAISGMVTAAIDLKRKGEKDFGIILTTGEETIFDGAKKIIEEGLEIPFIIVGEPTSLQLVNAHFGILVFKITAKGKSAHSSNPKEGINAIELLLSAVEKVNKISIYPETTLTLAQISGGVADNIIPEEAYAIYSMRISPNDKQRYTDEVKFVLPQNVTIEETQNVSCIETIVPNELSFIKKTNAVKYFTELSFFKKGVVIGPGDVAFAHGPDERLSKKELSESVKVYSQIMRNFTRF